MNLGLTRLFAFALVLVVSQSAWAGSVTDIGGKVTLGYFGPPSDQTTAEITNGMSFTTNLPIENPDPSTPNGISVSYNRTDPSADQTNIVFTVNAPNGQTNNPPQNNLPGWLMSETRSEILITTDKYTQVDLTVPADVLNFTPATFDLIYPGGNRRAFFVSTITGINSNFPLNPDSMMYETYTDSFVLSPGIHLIDWKLNGTTPEDPIFGVPGPVGVTATFNFTTIPTPTALLAGGLLITGLALRRSRIST